MALNIANIPSVSDAIVEMDVTTLNWATPREVQGEIVSVNVSGGEVGTRDLSVLDGTVFTKGGKTASHDVVVQAVFTDGETSDLHPVLEGKKGNTVGIRWEPKGTGGTRRFATLGTLYRIDPPSLSGEGDVLYTYGIRGQVAGEAST